MIEKYCRVARFEFDRPFATCERFFVTAERAKNKRPVVMRARALGVALRGKKKKTLALRHTASLQREKA